jgi:hypothetical protein
MRQTPATHYGLGADETAVAVFDRCEGLNLGRPYCKHHPLRDVKSVANTLRIPALRLPKIEIITTCYKKFNLI